MNYKTWIIVAVSLFVAGTIAGLFTPAGLGLTEVYLASFRELGEILSPFSLSTFVFIYGKNVMSLLLSFILGPFLCFVPVFALLVNGWLVGYVSSVVVREESIGYLLAGLAPHGILELPAVIIGQAAALSFGAAVILAVFRQDRRGQLMPSLKRNLGYLLIACGLLLPAAALETFVTPLLLL